MPNYKPIILKPVMHESGYWIVPISLAPARVLYVMIAGRALTAEEAVCQAETMLGSITQESGGNGHNG